MARKIWIPALLLAGAAWLTYQFLSPQTHAAPAASDSAAVFLTPEDLSRALGHDLRKLRVPLPKGDYAICAWAEHWQKGDPIPKLTLLFSSFISPTDEAIVVFDMPTPQRPEWFFAFNGSSNHGKIDDLAGKNGFSSLGYVPANIRPGADIELGIVVPLNKDGSPTGAFGTTDRLEPSANADNTYIYRARITAGRDAMMPAWNGKSVELTKWKQ